MRAGMALVGCMVLTACGGTVVSTGAAASPTAVTTIQAVAAAARPMADGGGSAAIRRLDRAELASRLTNVDGVVVDRGRTAVAELGPWITVRGGVAGYADLPNALFADFSGDGSDEAVVLVRPAAGQAATGAVVLTATADRPVIVGDEAFYRSFGFDTRATAEGGELVLRHRVGAGWEPACCWSGQVTRRFRVVRGILSEADAPLEVGDPVARGFTVDRFYALAAARNLDAALALLTTAERSRTVKSQWPLLLAQADEVAASMLATPRPDGLVPFRLVLRAGGRFQAWQGGAALVYNPPTHSWLIDLLSLQPEGA